MAQRFIIDVNINNGRQRARGEEGDSDLPIIGAAAAGVVAAGGSDLYPGTLPPKTKAGKERGWAIPYRSEGWISQRRWNRDNMPHTIFGEWEGTLSPDWTRRNVGTTLPIEQETLIGRLGLKKSHFQGLGMATAWKAAGTIVDLSNHTSGDAVQNQNRQRGMKIATYGATIAASGFNAAVIAGIIGNEVINSAVQGFKYNYDRKLERAQLASSSAILGDISYGRRGG